MSFINLRTFGKDNLEYLEIRRSSFRLNFRLMVFNLAFINLALVFFYLFPLAEGKHNFPVISYFPINFDLHEKTYLILYFLNVCASWAFVVLIPTSSCFISCLIAFLSNEFKILGLAYKNIFDDMKLKGDDISKESLDRIENALKTNIIHHIRLLKYEEILLFAIFLIPSFVLGTRRS